MTRTKNKEQRIITAGYIKKSIHGKKHQTNRVYFTHGLCPTICAIKPCLYIIDRQ